MKEQQTNQTDQKEITQPTKSNMAPEHLPGSDAKAEMTESEKQAAVYREEHGDMTNDNT
ncbi:MAG TPA: hypothetical protein VEY32_09390 [Flavisolibacter sp.]|jgi:hypothetical protein|nr:hypothetical protein [Flavisolibacter sp.]